MTRLANAAWIFAFLIAFVAGEKSIGIVIGANEFIARDAPLAISAFSEVVDFRTSEDSPAAKREKRTSKRVSFRSIRSLEFNHVFCFSTGTCVDDFHRYFSSGSKWTINRLPYVRETLWSKSALCDLTSSQELLRFAFECYVLPRDVNALRARDARDDGEAFEALRWIAKPFNGGGGNGITVHFNVTTIPLQKKLVVQRYLHDSHLLRRYKWDLRTYVLISTLHPSVTSYTHARGLVRFASAIASENPTNRRSFLTNTSVNGRESTASFAKLRRDLGSIAFDGVFTQITQSTHALLVATRRVMAQKSSSPRAFAKLCVDSSGASLCWQLLGIDYIVDAELKPWLVEVNGEPSMKLLGVENSTYDETKKRVASDVARVVFGSPEKTEFVLNEARATGNDDEL